MKINRKGFLSTVGKWKTLSKKDDTEFSHVYVDAYDDSIDFRYVGTGYTYTAKFDTEKNDILYSIFVFFPDLIKAVKTSKTEYITIDKTENGILIDGIFPIVDTQNLKDKAPDGLAIGRNLGGFFLSSNKIERLQKMLFCHVSEDKYRYFMNGIFLEKKRYDDFLSVVATDGRTMAVYKIYGIEETDEFSIILPVKYLAGIPKGSDVEFSVFENGVQIADDTRKFTFYSVKIDGQFPNYSRIIPDSYVDFFDFSSTDMLEALKKIRPFTDKQKMRIYISVNDEFMTIKNDKIEIQIATIKSSTDIEFAVNIDYLIKSIDSDTDITRVNHGGDSMHCITIEGDILRIIMPMQLD